jgi:trans-aconitate methyltransferase
MNCSYDIGVIHAPQNMKPEAALSLIEDGVERTNTQQIWADLGAGNGVFTHALSTLLHDGSILYAIDIHAARMESIRVWQQIVLKKIQADFVGDAWKTEPLHGALMANSLHFVKDKQSFLRKLKTKLAPEGKLLVIEYEMEKGNTWVPYPVGFKKLSEIVKEAGFYSLRRLKEVRSVYDNRMIYSAVTE